VGDIPPQLKSRAGVSKNLSGSNTKKLAAAQNSTVKGENLDCDKKKSELKTEGGALVPKELLSQVLAEDGGREAANEGWRSDQRTFKIGVNRRLHRSRT